MKKTKRIETTNDGLKIRGFFRLKIGEPDKNGVVNVADGAYGDSGWHENTITNLGKDAFLSQLLANMAGSLQVKYAALGTGGTLNATATALTGELTGTGLRMAVTPTTINQSGTVQFAFTLNSGFTAGTGNISNVGLFAISNATSGQVFAGNTYASSALASNQAVLKRLPPLWETILKKLREIGKTLHESIPREGLNTLVETMYEEPLTLAKI